TRFLAEPGTAALRTNRVAAITAEEDANMQLVFFCFQIFEELTDCIHNERALVRREIAERNIHSNAARSGGFLQIVEVSSITRLGPRFDRSLVQRLAFVRDHKVEIEVDRVAKPLAARACAKRIVE